MINDDILIKIARSRGHKEDWPQAVRYFRNRLTEIKLGFPGIRNDHMDIITYDQIKDGDYFIYDPYFETGNVLDKAPKMLRVVDGEAGRYFVIEGIGCGLDLDDPDRNRYRYLDAITNPFDDLNPSSLCFRVNVRPTLTGGPGYYYFMKSYRDARM